jgi:hypothetical protein
MAWTRARSQSTGARNLRSCVAEAVTGAGTAIYRASNFLWLWMLRQLLDSYRYRSIDIDVHVRYRCADVYVYMH